MPLNEFLSVCPADCDTALNLPAIDVSQDCTKVTLTKSQVRNIVLLPSGATKAVDWTLVANWSTVIDNTDTTGAKAKRLLGIGGIAAPEKTTVDMPNFKTKTTDRVYTLTFTVMNLSDAQYAFCRALQCGDTNQLLWYDDVDYLYGGQDGIQIKSIDCDFPKPEGASEYNTAVITIVWEADGDPLRTPTIF